MLEQCSRGGGSMIQTRSETTGILKHKTFQDAISTANLDSSIWKISFEIEDGTRVRLVRTQEGWVYENVMSGMRFS